MMSIPCALRSSTRLVMASVADGWMRPSASDVVRMALDFPAGGDARAYDGCRRSGQPRANQSPQRVAEKESIAQIVGDEIVLDRLAVSEQALAQDAGEQAARGRR